MKYLHSLRDGLKSLIEKENVYIIGEDIQDPYGGAFKVTKGLSEKYPNNIIPVPMCEQGFTGLGIGMALQGKKVIVEIMFGDFITLAVDQMVNHAAKFYELYRENISIILRFPSGGYRGYGATHSQSLETLFLSIPGIQVISPSIAHEPGELLMRSLMSGMPTLFVENKMDYSRDLLENRGVFWKKETSEDLFPVVALRPLGQKPDISIVVYGGLVEMAMEVMHDLLYEEEINVEIIVPSSLTDYSSLLHFIVSDHVVVLEEGAAEFGWASQISSYLFQNEKKCSVVGSKRKVIPSSKIAENFVLPSKDDVMKKVIEGYHNE